jgi:hypothetical protein
MTLEKLWVGIDVSQAELDIHLLPPGLSWQQPNTEAGIALMVAIVNPRNITMTNTNLPQKRTIAAFTLTFDDLSSPGSYVGSYKSMPSPYAGVLLGRLRL